MTDKPDRVTESVVDLIVLLRRFEEAYSAVKGLPWIGVVRPEQAFGRAAAALEALTTRSQPGEDAVEDFLHELDGWERAYPLASFPEPDLAKAAALLKAGGMTLDAVSASNMRHVVSMIAPKARAALNAAALPVENPQ